MDQGIMVKVVVRNWSVAKGFQNPQPWVQNGQVEPQNGVFNTVRLVYIDSSSTRTANGRRIKRKGSKIGPTVSRVAISVDVVEDPRVGKETRAVGMVWVNLWNLTWIFIKRIGEGVEVAADASVQDGWGSIFKVLTPPSGVINKVVNIERD